MLRALFVIVLLLATASGCAQQLPQVQAAQPASPPPDGPSPQAQLQTYMQTLVASGRFAGTLTVLSDHTQLYSLTTDGLVTTQGGPHQGEARAPVGSITKPFTVALVGRLASAGKIQLTQRLDTLLKGVPEAFAATTVLDIVRHNTRFTREPSAVQPDTLKAAVQACLAEPPFDRPDPNKPHYSNCAYNVLAHALAEAMGQPFEQLMATYVLDPMGIRDATWLKDGPNLATQRYLKGQLVPQLDHAVKHSWGSGGLVTSPSSLQRFFVQANEPGFLKPEVAAQLPPFQSHAGRIPGYIAFAAYQGGKGLFFTSVVDETPMEIIGDLMAFIGKGKPLPERQWRVAAIDTPADVLGGCAGTFWIPALGDPTLRLVFETTPTGPKASIHQKGVITPHRMTLASDGWLYLVEPKDDTTLLPMSFKLPADPSTCPKLPMNYQGQPLELSRYE